MGATTSPHRNGSRACLLRTLCGVLRHWLRMSHGLCEPWLERPHGLRKHWQETPGGTLGGADRECCLALIVGCDCVARADARDARGDARDHDGAQEHREPAGQQARHRHRARHAAGLQVRAWAAWDAGCVKMRCCFLSSASCKTRCWAAGLCLCSMECWLCENKVLLSGSLQDSEERSSVALQ